MKLIEIVKSSKPEKKWMAIFDDDGKRKVTHFGASGMTDYTISKDAVKAEAYRARHRKDLNTNDPTRPGYLSYYVLWSSPDLAKNIRDYKKRFNL